MLRLLPEALSDLRAHRWRSVLSATSLFVGVLAIVAVYTVSAIVKDLIIANAEQVNGRQITMGSLIPAETLASRGVPTILADLDRRVTRAAGSYALILQTSAQVGPTPTAVQPQPVNLVAGSLDHVRRLPVVAGHWLDPDNETYPGGIVVNQAAAELYGGVGAEISLELGSGFPAYERSITGEVADGLASPEIYEPLVSAITTQPGIIAAGSSIQLYVHNNSASESALRQTIVTVDADLDVDPGSVEIERTDTVGQLVANLQTTRAAFLAVSVVTLIVAALGLLNIGLSTVHDRTRELTIRRATGATKIYLFMLVLSSAVLLGILAAAAADIVAFATVEVVVPHFINSASALQPPAFPYPAAIAGLMVALVIAALAALIPALVATRVDMALVLRE